MHSIAPRSPRYTYTDRLFLRWINQNTWSANTKRICIKLFEQQRKHGQAYIFHRTLAEWLGISVATVKRSLQILVQAGVLEISHQIRYDGGFGSNRYKVVPRLPEDVDLVRLDRTIEKRKRATRTTPVPDQNELPSDRANAGLAKDVAVQNAVTEKIIIQKKINNSRGAIAKDTPPSTDISVVVSKGQAQNNSRQEEQVIRETRSAASLGSVLSSWADSIRKPAIMTPVPDQNELPSDRANEGLTSDVAVQKLATEKIIIQKKINNSSSNEMHQQMDTSEELKPVVVLNANASNTQNMPSKATKDEPAWIQRLRRIGTQETIDRIVGWYKACPSHHPARPKYPAAWIYAGVRDNWQEPPTWVKQTPIKPPVLLRALSDEEAAQQEAARQDALHRYQAQERETQQEWAAIEEVLAASTPETTAFEADVHRYLVQQLGGPLGEAAWASRGPTWRNACREVWRVRQEKS
ncbi:MAG: hypothetical protein OWR62_10170 [Sulfobacillus thermotolerans]|nr:hypothetical protein [Sulfobacillus thermotolerans]